MPKITRKNTLERIVARINAGRPTKNLEAGTFGVEASDRVILSRVKYVVTTGIQAFDDCIGGVPFGRIAEWYGLESCLDGNTFIPYEVRTPQGKTQNSKGGSLEHLYERFHGKSLTVDGHSKGSHFWVPSADDKGCILMNKVVDVVKTGKKPCFEVETESGRVLNSTLDHKFLVETGYRPLSELTVGDCVFSTPWSWGAKNDANLRFITSPDKIVSITPVGFKDTYDIKCASPNHNYVANGIVVHNCGKTAMAIRTAVRAQQGFIFERIVGKEGEVTLKKIPKNSDVTILYIDNEHSLDDDAKLVVDGTRLKCVLGFADTISQLFKAVEIFVTELEKVQKETEREQFLVVVVDTIAGTSSHQEMKSEWGKEDYVRQPKQLREGFRVMHSQISRANVALICLNQVSDSFKPKVMTGFRPSNTPQDSDYTTFGGRALKYWSSQRIFMYQVDSKYKLERGAQFAAGFNIGFYAVKNRMAGQFPSREGRMPLLFGHGFHNEFSILEHLLFLGLAEYEEGGMISFRFKANGVEVTTFATKATKTSLEEDDLGEETEKKKASKGNPKINSRAEFIGFYRDHQADVEALLAAGKRMMFASQARQSPLVEMDVSEDDEVEVEPDSIPEGV